MHNKADCCGCTACQQICPVPCITMEPDEEGFLYPKINEGLCIGCRKCEAVCPIQSPPPVKAEAQTYVGYAKNENVRSVSSSGGIFSLAAAYVFKRGGVVFGAAFDDAFAVHHICVESEKDLDRLRGSKYVESRLEDTYGQAKRRLMDGQWVLFSGTACQIAGLQKYLGNEYDRLLTIDVLCHGVPSPKIWKAYLEEQQRKYRSQITAIQFRNKRLGWKRYSVRIQFANGREYAVPFTKDKFMNLFLANMDLRPSCYDCRFKAFPRPSDLTIGDCWGIERHLPELDDDKGASVLVVQTEKGQALLNEIRSGLLCQRAEGADWPITADIKTSVARHPKTSQFWAGVGRGEPFGVLHKYLRTSIVHKAVSLLRYLAMTVRQPPS